MTKAEITELLSRVPLFSGCSQREIAAIGRAAKEVHRRRGSVLARTGEAGVGFFLLVDGDASVLVNGRKRSTLHGRRLLRRDSRCWTAGPGRRTSWPTPT